jgi:hypothetical protein
MCVSLWPLSTLGAWMLVGFAVAVCGVGAAYFGDTFWANFRWLR